MWMWRWKWNQYFKLITMVIEEANSACNPDGDADSTSEDRSEYAFRTRRGDGSGYGDGQGFGSGYGDGFGDFFGKGNFYGYWSCGIGREDGSGEGGGDGCE